MPPKKKAKKNPTPVPPKKKAKKNPTPAPASNEPPPKPTKKASKNPLYIDWNHSKPKCIILEDLISGILPVDESYMSAEAAWDVHYRFLPEFKRVVFEQFKDRLKDHRKLIQGDLGRALQEETAVMQHRQLFPRKQTNPKGEPVFDLHPAKDMLREDIEQNRHIGLKPSQFRNTRDEYKLFSKKIFKHRVYQEIRRKKFVNFLNEQRNQGNLLRCKPPPDKSGAPADDS